MEKLTPEQEQEQIKAFQKTLEDSFETLRTTMKEKLNEQVDVIVDVFINGFRKGFDQHAANTKVTPVVDPTSGEQGNSFVKENLDPNDDLAK